MPINIAFYFRGSAIFVHPHLSWVKEMTYFPFSHFFSFFCVIVELNLPSPPSCLRAQPTFWMPADVDSHFFFVCGLHKRWWWWWCVKYILLSRLFLFFCSVGLCFCAFVTLYHMSNLPLSPLPLLPTCLLFTSSLSVSICLCSFSFLLQVLLFFFFLLGRKK